MCLVKIVKIILLGIVGLSWISCGQEPVILFHNSGDLHLLIGCNHALLSSFEYQRIWVENGGYPEYGKCNGENMGT